MKMRVLGLIIAFLSKSALSATESGTQLEWSANTAVGHTDNVTLVESDPTSQTIASVGGTIDLTRDGSRINATLRGDGNFLSYLDDAYEDEFLGSGVATLLVGLIGDTLTWSLDDTFGQTTTNEFEPPTPDNRGNVNVLTTGPDLRLPMGRANELIVRGRYQNSTYESVSSVDSQSWIGGATVVRRISPGVAWSLNANSSHTTYDDSASSDFNEQELFAQLLASGARQTLSIDLGVSFLDQGSETDSTPLVRVNWTRRLTPSWRLDVNASSEYLSAGEQFVIGVGDVPDGAELGGTQDVILTFEAHRNDSAGLSISFERPRTTLRLSGGANRERFPDSDSLDRDTWLVRAEASRQLTQRLQAFLEASYENREYRESNEDDNTTIVSARLDWRLGKAFFLGLTGGTERRSGNTDFSYDETVYRAALIYRPSGS